MRSLFLRIFVGFWLANALIVAVLVVSSPYWTRVRPAVAAWEQRVVVRLLQESEHVVRAIADDGPAALAEEAGTGHDGRRHGPQQLTLLAADRSVVAGAPLPAGARQRAARAGGRGGPPARPRGREGGHPRPAVGPDGRQFTLVVAASGGRGGRGGPGGPFTRSPNPVEVLDARVVAPRLVAVVLVVGLLCYWLSRYLTSPLSRLRAATTALAGGDLAARVGLPTAARADEIGDLARDFDTMAERVEHLVAAQRQLLRDVSHELRSPLARLDVAVALARDGDAGGVATQLDRIARESGRLNELIGRLLELARLEAGDAGNGADDAAPFDLALAVAEVVEDARFEAAGRGCRVDLVAPPTPVPVSANAELVRTVIDNILRNAVRHTTAGSAVEVDVASDGAAVEVTVRDHGPGVPDADLERIFAPFVRVGDDRDRATGGAGLGLAIADRAARRCRGHLAARNHPAGGLVLTLRLPRAEVAEPVG